ncbi:MAG: SLC13 family permease [Chloroflexota bacterium]|nr:SLC13 family permease [Chloroflexota bacterium]MDE2682651.1 SLC13 family permease [Chloroflexota bacterium]
MKSGSPPGAAAFSRAVFNPTAVKFLVAFAVFAAILLMPTPEGLTLQGQRSLAVMTFIVVLWATEVIHTSVAGIIGVVLLVLFGAVPGIGEAVYGFSQPVCYFLIGILTLGLAVHQSGLAERMAIFLMRGAVGSPYLLYLQMLFSFAALTFALPSASTRGAIMVHVYEQVLEQWNIPQGHPFYKATMMAMGALNRLGSTALLAGGITPVVASGLLGDFSWTQWFVIMSVPFYANLIVGGTMLFLFYRAGFRNQGAGDAAPVLPGPIKPAEWRAGAIVMVTALMWFTDFAHGLHPAVPALIALCLILLPRVGILTWGEFERNVGWTNFFVIATSLSLSHALVTSGAAAWFSETLVGGVSQLVSSPMLILLALCVCFALLRMLLPNIAGYLALVIPVTMAAAESLGLNPLVCGFAAVVVGDSAVYYGAGGTSAVFIFQRANISNPEIFRFGITMTVAVIAVLMLLVVPYWNLVGYPLAP